MTELADKLYGENPYANRIDVNTAALPAKDRAVVLALLAIAWEIRQTRA